MTDDTPEPASAGIAEKPARKPRARALAPAKRKTAVKAQTAANLPPRPASVVPRVPAAAFAAPPRPRASAWRLGLLAASLAALVGGLAWIGDAPERVRSELTRIASRAAATPAAPESPLAPHVGESIAREHRLATMILDLQEREENLRRLWSDTQSLASGVGALASGIETLKSNVDAVRSAAAAGFIGLDSRLHTVEAAASAEPNPVNRPIEADADIFYRLQRLEAKAQAAQESEPAMTGAVLEVSPPAPAPEIQTETVSFARPKPRSRTRNPMRGWVVHSARDDRALVGRGGTHYEVRPGELLPGAGLVRSIQKRGERWVVLTGRGVITDAR